MNENQIIKTLKYISKFVENRHDEGLGDYLHIVIGRTDINVIDETIYLLERKQKEIKRYKKEIKNQQKEIEELKNNELDYTTIYMNGVYDGEKKVKDKIREKIEEAKEIKWHTPKLVIEYFEELLEEK